MGFSCPAPTLLLLAPLLLGLGEATHSELFGTKRAKLIRQNSGVKLIRQSKLTYSTGFPHKFNDFLPQGGELLKRFLALLFLVALKLRKGQGLTDVKVDQRDAGSIPAGPLGGFAKALNVNQRSLKNFIGYKQGLVQNGPETASKHFKYNLSLDVTEEILQPQSEDFTKDQ